MAYKNNLVIRPILNIKKSEILAYVKENKIPYRIDSTNLVPIYTRNKLRLEIIPLIEELNPNFKEALFKLGDLSRENLEILDSYDRKTFNNLLIDQKDMTISFKKDGFENLTKGEKARFLRYSIKKLKGDSKDLSKDQLERLLEISNLAVGKKCEKGDLVLEKAYTSYKLYIKKAEAEEKEALELNLNQTIFFSSYKISAFEVSRDFFLSHRSMTRAFFDKDSLEFPLTVRKRVAGDYFYPFGGNYRKKLKDYFIDEKIDRDLRDKYPVILSGGEIIRLAPLRRSNLYKVGPDKEIIMIEVEENEN